MINIEIKNLDKVIKDFGESNVKKLVAYEIQKAIISSAYLVQGEAKRKVKKDTGNLAANIITKFDVLRGEVKANTDYAIFVEEDTRPHFPPIDAIRPWAERHGINPYKVIRGIGKKGTKGVHFMRDAVDNNMHKINQFFDDAGERIANKLNS